MGEWYLLGWCLRDGFGPGPKGIPFKLSSNHSMVKPPSLLSFFHVLLVLFMNEEYRLHLLCKKMIFFFFS